MSYAKGTLTCRIWKRKPSDIPPDITFAIKNAWYKLIRFQNLRNSIGQKKDTFGVNLKTTVNENTKQGMLKVIASIFDSLGII